MFKRLQSNRLYIVLGPLALTAPLTSFLSFYEVPFLSQEAFYPFAILTGVGLLTGLIMALGGNLVQALISSGIIVLLVCGETPSRTIYLDGIRFRYVFFLSIFIVGTILYFLRENRVRFLLLIFGVMWITGTVTPINEKTQVLEKMHEPDTSLPPYIHIVLDEHIGIEGVHSSWDKNNYFSEKFKKQYVDQGFLLFGRAYSRFKKTELSFHSFLNMSSSYDTDVYTNNIKSISPNKLFDNLTKRGYIINTFTTLNLSLCDNNGTYRFGKCVSVVGGGLKGFHDGEILLHNFVRKMRLLNMYDVARQMFNWPELNTAIYPGTMKAVNNANKFINFLGEGKRGNAYLIHLLLPHTPYLLDDTCKYKNYGNYFKKQKWETEYERYVEQTKCTHGIVGKIISKLDSNPEAQDSTIVIHGDHGSRVPEKRNGTVEFDNGEYIQFFSTHFSVRAPNLNPGYDRRPFALDELLKVFTLPKPDISLLENNKEKFVYTPPFKSAFNRFEIHKRVTLPPFENGSMSKAW
jgi:hypothetical protein